MRYLETGIQCLVLICLLAMIVAGLAIPLHLFNARFSQRVKASTYFKTFLGIEKIIFIICAIAIAVSSWLLVAELIANM